MMMHQTELFPAPTADELATLGMSRAAEHADAQHPGWGERAYWMLESFAFQTSEFMGEDVRKWAHERGLPLPPDGRAWGAVVHRAVRKGLIVCDRYQKTRIPPAHATPRAVWRSQIYVKDAA